MKDRREPACPQIPHIWSSTKMSDTDIQFVRCSLHAATDSVPDRDYWTSALSNLRFWVTSFPRRREPRSRHWISACAGMTVNPKFKLVNPNFGLCQSTTEGPAVWIVVEF